MKLKGIIPLASNLLTFQSNLKLPSDHQKSTTLYLITNFKCTLQVLTNNNIQLITKVPKQ
jgi:hypothetical protein